MIYASWAWLLALPFLIASCIAISFLALNRAKIRTFPNTVLILEGAAMGLLGLALIDTILDAGFLHWKLRSFLAFGLQGVGLSSMLVIINSLQIIADQKDESSRTLLPSLSRSRLDLYSKLRAFLRLLPLMFDFSVVFVLMTSPHSIKLYLPVFAIIFALGRFIVAVWLFMRSLTAMRSSMVIKDVKFYRRTMILAVVSMWTIAILPLAIITTIWIWWIPARLDTILVSYGALASLSLAANSIAQSFVFKHILDNSKPSSSTEGIEK